MLNQEQEAFIKALSHSELSTVYLQELRKAMAAANKRKLPWLPRPTLRTPQSSSVKADLEASLISPMNFRSSQQANGKLTRFPALTARLSQSAPPCTRDPVRSRA
jgi:hypothetical protein